MGSDAIIRSRGSCHVLGDRITRRGPPSRFVARLEELEIAIRDARRRRRPADVAAVLFEEARYVETLERCQRPLTRLGHREVLGDDSLERAFPLRAFALGRNGGVLARVVGTGVRLDDELRDRVAELARVAGEGTRLPSR